LSSGYAAKVEFGLKLGYTESLVQAALQKLGAQVPRQQDLAPEGADESDSTLDTLVDDAVTIRLRPVVIDGSNVAMR
jgi:ribonuclease ZC3H12